MTPARIDPAVRDLFETLLASLDRAIAIHARVSMDTPEDRRLHRLAVVEMVQLSDALLARAGDLGVILQTPGVPARSGKLAEARDQLLAAIAVAARPLADTDTAREGQP